MKKLLIPILFVLSLSGCATDQYGRTESAGCGTNTNIGGAAIGALGGAVVGSLIGGGTGNVLATVGGAAAGGYVGSQSKIGCR